MLLNEFKSPLLKFSNAHKDLKMKSVFSSFCMDLIDTMQ